MQVTYAPRSQLADHFRHGWRLIPGHDYAREDWAVLLMKTDEATSPAELRCLCAAFTLETRSNRSRGSSSRNTVLRAKRFEALT